MTFKIKIKIFIRYIRNNIRIRLLGISDIKNETILLVEDNYRLLKEYSSRTDLFEDNEINILFTRELYGVIKHISQTTFYNVDICLLRVKYLLKLHNNILLVRGDILDKNIDTHLNYIKYKIIQYGGSIDENI